jgi:hypothetical protein
MKIMSGAEPESKPDYSEQTRKELDKVQSRAILLNNMLDNANEGEKFAQGDAYEVSVRRRSNRRRVSYCTDATLTLSTANCQSLAKCAAEVTKVDRRRRRGGD